MGTKVYDTTLNNGRTNNPILSRKSERHAIREKEQCKTSLLSSNMYLKKGRYRQECQQSPAEQFRIPKKKQCAELFRSTCQNAS
jgi:hypothetical protein